VRYGCGAALTRLGLIDGGIKFGSITGEVRRAWLDWDLGITGSWALQGGNGDGKGGCGDCEMRWIGAAREARF
jgi:hypothetical protein